MGKLPDLDAFDHGQIVGAQRKGHSISEIVRQLEISRSTVSRLRHFIRSQRSQTLAQITNQLNDGASRTVSKRTVQRSLLVMGLVSLLPTRIPLLNAHHRASRLAWAKEQIPKTSSME
ncbi:HTH_Tnp_Tc3_2 domain-containing protein [Trichonephila clavipes]|nr:HTH_Tnp_Tc3_2 domain-containing protein [Trichonephila clavipes]